MPKLDMRGPFSFTDDEIDREITEKRVGNYALGYINEKNQFIVRYVGRSDNDVKKRIKDHLGKSYTHFKFEYAKSPKAAFEKECQNYHDFGESKLLDNEIHPDLPDESKNWKCPVCG
nr:MAG TPA: RUBREDOXIN TRANSPORT, RUBREDOXIN, GUILLARDIA THETA [Caudoviricetes sp.]